ncbi:DUF47 family protein [Candidatus Woesearchaeota archaeon]|nr:DUF47 family protein [Candidatus Woesearchaeota archaeon]
MKKIMHWIIPKEKEFFEMLEQQSENAVEAAKELRDFIGNYHNFERKERKFKASAIKNIEAKGDEMTRGMALMLNKSFRASIGREDLQKMIDALDDILDGLNSIASKLVVLNIERIEDNMVKLVDIISDAVAELSKSIADLRKLKNAEEVHSRIKSLERRADEIYNEALSELFHFYKNSVDIMKYREIYELLEKTADKCLDAADIIQNIAVKRG